MDHYHLETEKTHIYWQLALDVNYGHEQFCEQHNVLYRNYRLLDITVANAYHGGPFIVRWRIIYFIVPLFC